MHELSKLVTDYKSLKKSIADLEQKLKGIEEEIKNYMGENEEINVDGIVVRWKNITQNRFDSTAFKNQHIALYEQFLVETKMRRFQIS